METVNPWLIILGVVIAILISLNFTIACNMLRYNLKLPNTPAELHDRCSLNWFGTVVAYIFLIILLLPIYIVKFVKFIFTAGRK